VLVVVIFVTEVLVVDSAVVNIVVLNAAVTTEDIDQVGYLSGITEMIVGIISGAVVEAVWVLPDRLVTSLLLALGGVTVTGPITEVIIASLAALSIGSIGGLVCVLVIFTSNLRCRGRGRILPAFTRR
jgi:NADH:ubiquinone oxidoreductase subunit 4 (subunit M)